MVTTIMAMTTPTISSTIENPVWRRRIVEFPVMVAVVAKCPAAGAPGGVQFTLIVTVGPLTATVIEPPGRFASVGAVELV